MPNPIEILGRSRRRLALIAAARTIAYAILPALVAIALAVSLGSIGNASWKRWGYILGPASERVLTFTLIGIAALVAVTAVAMAALAYRRAAGFIEAADRVDRAVNGHQQVLTFASFADPSASENVRRRRSPLFPLLWQSAAAFLEGFKPERAFPMELGRPILRSSVFAVGIALALVVATFGLVHPPSRLQVEAIKLREIASAIEKSSTEPSQLALAASVRGVADALEDPKLSPEQKKQRLEEVMQQMASHSEDQTASRSQKNSDKSRARPPSIAQPGQGNGNDSNSLSENQTGQGQQGGGAGNSNQAGTGSEKNQAGKGAGQNDKNQPDKNSIELQNELAKAETEIENEGEKNPGQASPSSGEQNKGEAPQAGNNANQKTAGNEPNPKQLGNIPKPESNGNKNQPQPGGSQQASGKDEGSNLGDTHLGEFPTPTKTQRFAPGGTGPGLDIHDARYVMFRLPSAIPVKGGGVTVLDPTRTKASTPYVNAPLKETSSDAPPDERQLVPPRFRDLIH